MRRARGLAIVVLTVISPSCRAVAPAENSRVGPAIHADLAHTFAVPSGVPREVAFSPDGRRLAISSVDRTVTLWRISDCVLEQTLTHPEGVTSIAFSPDGSWLASGSEDRTVNLWRLTTR